MLSVFAAYSENIRSPALHFLDIGTYLFMQVLISCKGYDKSAVFYKGYSAVFQFACRIGLRMDIGNFLEFQRAFKRKGIVYISAYEKDIFSCI